MASQCLPLLLFDAVRVTKLTNCGAVNDTGCSYATSTGVISLSMEPENVDRQEYLQLNGQGLICVDETVERQLKWINVELQFCNVDPELFNIITSETLVLNDATSPVAIGWDTTTSGPITSYFALEGWTNTNADACVDGRPDYGYFLLPFLVGAQVGNITLENGNINFTVTARTKFRSLWGNGPYNVRLSYAVGAQNLVPQTLLTSVGNNVHRRQFWTELPPPPTFCGCQDVTPALVVTPQSATAATLRTMTIPIDPVTGVGFPGYVIWGDATPPTLVAAGTVSATHTYAIGTYTASFKPTAYSTPSYTLANIVAS